MQLPTSIGTLNIPALGGSLTLTGKDSKIHVVDYTAGSTSIVYSTGEILTWYVQCSHACRRISYHNLRATIDGQDIILLYGNAGELHETAFKFSTAPPAAKVISGSAAITQKALAENTLALQYTTSGQTVIQLGPKTKLYILGALIFALITKLIHV